MGDIVDYNRRGKSGVNETADRFMIWNNSTRGGFWNDSVKSILVYWRLSIECMDLPRVGGVENYSVDSDCREKSDVDETSDQ